MDDDSTNIIMSLQKELNELQRQEKESMKQLSDVFAKKFAIVQREKSKVIDIQNKLQKDSKDLTAEKEKLEKAV